MEPKKEYSEENKMSLWEFVDLNHKPISVLGVMIAIAAFSTKLSLDILSYNISFCFIFTAIILSMEVWNKFPGNTFISTRLFFFKQAFFLGIFFIMVYWILAFRQFIYYFIFLGITVLSTFLISQILPPVYRPVFKWMKKGGIASIIKLLFEIVMLVVAIKVSSYIAKFISPIIGDWLNYLWEQLKVIKTFDAL